MSDVSRLAPLSPGHSQPPRPYAWLRFGRAWPGRFSAGTAPGGRRGHSLAPAAPGRSDSAPRCGSRCSACSGRWWPRTQGLVDPSSAVASGTGGPPEPRQATGTLTPTGRPAASSPATARTGTLSALLTPCSQRTSSGILCGSRNTSDLGFLTLPFPAPYPISSPRTPRAPLPNPQSPWRKPKPPSPWLQCGGGSEDPGRWGWGGAYWPGRKAGGAPGAAPEVALPEEPGGARSLPAVPWSGVSQPSLPTSPPTPAPLTFKSKERLVNDYNALYNVKKKCFCTI